MSEPVQITFKGGCGDAAQIIAPVGKRLIDGNNEATGNVRTGLEWDFACHDQTGSTDTAQAFVSALLVARRFVCCETHQICNRVEAVGLQRSVCALADVVEQNAAVPR